MVNDLRPSSLRIRGTSLEPSGWRYAMNNPSVLHLGGTFLHGEAAAVFRVGTSKAGDVLMRVDRTDYRNDQRAVVVVDAARLQNAWKASSKKPEKKGLLARLKLMLNGSAATETSLAHLSLDEMAQDRKFCHAVNGFASCMESPVPLALVGFVDRTGTGIDFTNGITRTMWLLVNGARAFPIECSTSEAQRLSDTAGAPGHAWATVEELTASLRYRSWIDDELFNLPLLEQLR